MQQIIVAYIFTAFSLFLSLCTLIDAAEKKRPRFEQAIVEQESPLKKRKIDALEKKSYQCTYCSTYFIYKKSFNKHVKTHINAPAKEQKTPPRNYEHQCDFAGCTESFRLKAGLKSHKLIHDNNLPKVECPFCDKQFVSKKSKNRHVDLYCKKNPHKAEKKYPCDVIGCEKKFPQLCALKRHKPTHLRKKREVV
jgi:uncharacterized Zn-finger protein